MGELSVSQVVDAAAIENMVTDNFSTHIDDYS